MAIARSILSYNIGRIQAVSSSNIYTDVEKKLFASCSDEEKGSVLLNETELEEKFIRGSGPGGQKINKTSNCVELKHKKTGIIIKCQESRSLERNRQIARERLLDKLKALFSPSESSTFKKIEVKKKRESQAARRRQLKEAAIKNKVDI